MREERRRRGEEEERRRGEERRAERGEETVWLWCGGCGVVVGVVWLCSVEVVCGTYRISH
jgi:hypothetical protein